MPDKQRLSVALDRRFFAPLRRPRTRRVGVELEFPVWNRTPGAPTDFTAVHVAWLRPFKFADLTQRGTIEFRSVCEQPVRDALAPAAFHAGRAESLSSILSVVAPIRLSVRPENA